MFSPYAESLNLYKNNFGKLHAHSVPVIGVFGTSSKQGKWTLSIKLLKEFEINGYNVSYLGTEPNAPFFGSKYVLPLGYNSDFTRDQRELISLVNYYLHKLDNKVDLMLITSQSQTVSASYGGFSTLPIEQSSLIVGAAPQAYLLCINPWDNVDYINRTTNYITSYYEAKVLSIIIYVTSKHNVWDNIKGISIEKNFDYDKLLIDIKEKFHIPVYLSNDNQCIKEIYNNIVNYF